MTRLKAGDLAPDFTLRDHRGEETRLSSFRGKKHVLVAFVPEAWAPVCTAEVTSLRHEESAFDLADAQVVVVTPDNRPAQKAWAEDLRLHFPVCSDFWPHGDVARRYGVLRQDGLCERALFLVDKQGKLRFVQVLEMGFQPDTTVVLEEVEKLRKEAQRAAFES